MANDLSPMPTTPRTLTVTDAAKAFDTWETAYRADPKAFEAPEVTAARSDVSMLSYDRAVYFMQLLHFNGQR